MNFKKIYLTLFCRLCHERSWYSANSPSVLDQTASKLKASGGIEAQFEATQFVGVTENGTVGGQICVQGNRFKLTSPSITPYGSTDARSGPCSPAATK